MKNASTHRKNIPKLQLKTIPLLLFTAFFDGKYISGHVGDGLICISDEDLKFTLILKMVILPTQHTFHY